MNDKFSQHPIFYKIFQVLNLWDRSILCYKYNNIHHQKGSPSTDRDVLVDIMYLQKVVAFVFASVIWFNVL